MGNTGQRITVLGSEGYLATIQPNREIPAGIFLKALGPLSLSSPRRILWPHRQSGPSPMLPRFGSQLYTQLESDPESLPTEEASCLSARPAPHIFVGT